MNTDRGGEVEGGLGMKTSGKAVVGDVWGLERPELESCFFPRH